MAALMNGQRQRLGDKLGSLLPTIPRWGLELVIRQWLPAHCQQRLKTDPLATGEN
jgi:hypothetical protein